MLFAVRCVVCVLFVVYCFVIICRVSLFAVRCALFVVCCVDCCELLVGRRVLFVV